MKIMLTYKQKTVLIDNVYYKRKQVLHQECNSVNIHLYLKKTSCVFGI